MYRVALEVDRRDLDLLSLVDHEDDLLFGLGNVLDLELDGGASEPLGLVVVRDG
jgi:hypothetical protein